VFELLVYGSYDGRRVGATHYCDQLTICVEKKARLGLATVQFQGLNVVSLGLWFKLIVKNRFGKSLKSRKFDK
jgi:hypothetical protein